MTSQHRRRLSALAALVMVVLPLAGPHAIGAPADDKRSEAQRLQRQLDAQAEKVSALDEKFNRAQLAVERSRSEAAAAGNDLARADAQFQVIRQRMGRHALDAYVHGGNSGTIARLLKGNADDVLARHQYLEMAAADGRKAADDLKAAREDLSLIRSRQQSAQRDAQVAADLVDKDRLSVTRALAAQQATLSQVKGELGELVRAEQARKDAEAARQAELAREAEARRPATPAVSSPARTLPTTPGAVRALVPATPPSSSRPAPGVAGGAAAAVEEARRQVGKPYVYGGSGPDTFDCSGLTSFAWRTGGISLPHSASAQYAAVTHIAFADLQPGDLLFFYEDIHHVAIYVGGGQIIEASTSGTPVKYSSASRPNFIGAGRPA